MIGGNITVNLLQKMLEDSYTDPPTKIINGYVLDEEVSKKSILFSQMTSRVYVNETERKVMVSHRGTGLERYGSDWLNNIVYGVSGINAYKLTPRFLRAKAVHGSVIKKYKNYEVNTCGHSQAGLIAHLLPYGVKNVIQFNPASKSEQLQDNEYIIRSSKDLVSSLSVPTQLLNQTLYPGWSKKHYINIKAESENPLIEHSPAILSRLDPNMKIGKGHGRKKLIGYNINISIS